MKKIINLNKLEKQINTAELFMLALEYYNKLIDENLELSEELPENITFEDLSIVNKSIAVLLIHKSIECPSIEICLALNLRRHDLPIGHYYLIVDNETKFIDEYLIFE